MLRAGRQGHLLRDRRAGGVRMPLSAPSATAVDAEAVWLELHDVLLAFIRRRVPSADTAKDILQDVMLRIHRNAGALERAEAVGPWVHAIARNAIADHYRSASVRRELATGSGHDFEGAEAVIEAAGARAEPAGTAGARAELAACVAPLLRRLPESSRTALTLVEIEGLPQVEAARRLGLSHSGMKSRVQRGRRQLRDVLLRCCEVQLDARGDVSDYRPRQGRCGCGNGSDA